MFDQSKVVNVDVGQLLPRVVRGAVVDDDDLFVYGRASDAPDNLNDRAAFVVCGDQDGKFGTDEYDLPFTNRLMCLELWAGHAAKGGGTCRYNWKDAKLDRRNYRHRDNYANRRADSPADRLRRRLAVHRQYHS